MNESDQITIKDVEYQTDEPSEAEQDDFNSHIEEMESLLSALELAKAGNLIIIEK
jgi:hypothetical protein